MAITAKECNYILNNYIPTTRDPAESYLISLAQAYLDHEARVAELQEQIIIRDIIVNGAVEENNSLEAELAELRSENERLRAELHTEKVRVDELRKMYQMATGLLLPDYTPEQDGIKMASESLATVSQQDALRKGEWA